MSELKTFETNCLGFPLTLLLDRGGQIQSQMTEEGGTYPLLDFEYDTIWLRHAIEKEGRNYDHLYFHRTHENNGVN